MPLRSSSKISWPLTYLRVSKSNPQLQQLNTTRWDSPALKTSFKSSTQILPKSIFRPNPLGPLLPRFLFTSSRNSSNNLDKTSPRSASLLTFAKTSSAWNTVLEKGLHSARSSLRKTKNQILDGANPRKLIKRGYQNVCDYFDIMEKRILIQQRALACLSKSVAHILERELYTMANTGLLRREAEMTLLEGFFIPIWGNPDVRS